MKALNAPLAVILFTALLLQGCIAAPVVVGSAAVGTKTATDPRTVGTQVDDGTLELRVNSALSKDEQIKKEARINVTAYQGKVLLTGQAPNNADLASRAKQIAMGVEGTTEVFNEMRQGKPSGLGDGFFRYLDHHQSAFAAAGQRSGEILQREGDHRKRRSVPAGSGHPTGREGGGGYRQPGERREARHHRLYHSEIMPQAASRAAFFTPEYQSPAHAAAFPPAA